MPRRRLPRACSCGPLFESSAHHTRRVQEQSFAATVELSFRNRGRRSAMSLLVILIILLLLFGGGGMFIGGGRYRNHGFGLGGIVLVIIIILLLTGGLGTGGRI